MSATLAPSRFAPTSSRRLFTAADLAVLPTSLPSGDVRYELDDGELVTMAPAGHDHARHQHLVGIYLHTEAKTRGLGEACGEVGIVLRRNPDRVVGADAAFILATSLPARRSPEGYLETIPELVVEIRSPNDSGPEIVAKCDEYFAAGVREVWVIDAVTRTVAARSADGSVRIVREPDALTCEFLPGFALPLPTLFVGS